MQVLRRRRRLAGYTALALTLSSAAAVAAGPAQARVTVIPVVSHVVASWGANSFGELGDGSPALVSGPVQVTNLAGATQVAAGQLCSFAVHTVLGLVGQSS